MNNTNIKKKHETSIKKEHKTRALKVLKILGRELPKIYKSHEGRIELPNKEEPASNDYIKIQDDKIRISININKYKYTWDIIPWNDGTVSEKLSISMDNALNPDNDNTLNIYFYQRETTETSVFYLYSKTWSGLTIKSNVDSVTLRDNNDNKKFQIEDYYQEFSSVIKNNETKLIYLTGNPAIADIIIEMFKAPIKQLVDDLTHNDQSYRFRNERTAIRELYNRQVKSTKPNLELLEYYLAFEKESEQARINALKDDRKAYSINFSNQ